MQLFYGPQLQKNDKEYIFDETESRHIVKSVRKKSGDTLWITNGNGLLFQSTIIDADPKRCKVQLKAPVINQPDGYYLHMAVAPTKMNDRFEWFLEKATEIGVHEITPIITEHSERKTVKKERMERVVLAAMKQSFQTFLPKLNEALTLRDFFKLNHEGQLFIAHCDDTERQELKDNLLVNSTYTILIGPEGDFSPTEIDVAKSVGFQPISMGKNRLRTETAGVVACTTVAVIN